MKTAIVFYSFSGNTRSTCGFLKEELRKKNHSVELIEIKPRQEVSSFLHQGKSSYTRQTPELATERFDLVEFDLVIFASPVWAFTFTPALRTFLLKCTGLFHKKAAAVLTCGAELTSGKALPELVSCLTEKGANVIFQAYVAGHRNQDKPYLRQQFSKLFAGADAALLR